jgi:type VI secretion system secreted protein Hcp
MAVCALMRISNAQGECKMEGEYKDKWIEIQTWNWEVEAETSWTKGGGASVGKPNPGKMSWEHYFDRSSCILMNYISSGAAFEEVELRMFKGTGGKILSNNVFFRMIMKGAFITKINNKATEEGNVSQEVEMVFKEVEINYSLQEDGTKPGQKAGTLTPAGRYYWDIPAGTVK